jgi:hypothetical protein
MLWNGLGLVSFPNFSLPSDDSEPEQTIRIIRLLQGPFIKDRKCTVETVKGYQGVRVFSFILEDVSQRE